MADVQLVDGTRLSASDFGEYNDDNVWQPKKYSGAYGTNGFHLKFADNSSDSALGTDGSGNSNTWTVNNLTAAYSFGLTTAAQIVGTSKTFSFPITYTATLTYEFFVKITTDGTYNYMAKISGDQWNLGTSGSSLLFGNYNGGWTTFSNTGLNDSEWHFVRLTTTGSSTSLYVDGSLIATNSSGGSVSTGSQVTNEIRGTGSGAFEIAHLRITTGGTPPTTGVPDISNMNEAAGYGGTLAFYDKLDDIASSGTKTSDGGNVTITMSAATVGVTDANSDSLIDTPSNYEANSGNNGGNYCVWNPLSSNGGVTITNGNLDTVNTGSSYDNPRATFGMSSGKWYWEVKITSFAGGFHVGLALPTAANSSYLGATSGTWAYGDSGYKYDQGTSSNYGASFTSAGKVISCAFDADAGTVVFYNDGVSQGTAFTGLTNGPYLPALYARVNSTGGSWNFGQRPFIYTPPSGHKALCTQNLADPTIADGSNYFKAKLYTGVETANTNITGFNFSPDFVWLKRRDADVGHFLYDTIRGIRRSLYSNSSEAENNYSDTLEAFNSDGFTLGDSGFINSNNANYVSYAWEGASSTASNTNGNITSSVRANTSAGFSIVTWSGNSQNATVGHGLGAVPEMIFHKRRNGPASWVVYHKDVGNNKFLQFNAADGENQGSYFDNKSPTSTIFNVSDFDEINRTGSNYVAYCFTPVAGYSAFGSYSGNNNANGPYIYTGFRPAWLLIKRKNGSANWFLVDSARDTDNTVALYLKPNTNSAEIDTNTEGTKNYIDFLSNGFKLRGTEISTNASQDYIYAAFAEHPFKTARAR